VVNGVAFYIEEGIIRDRQEVIRNEGIGAFIYVMTRLSAGRANSAYILIYNGYNSQHVLPRSTDEHVVQEIDRRSVPIETAIERVLGN